MKEAICKAAEKQRRTLSSVITELLEKYANGTGHAKTLAERKMDNKQQQVNVLRRDTCGDCGAKEGQLHILGCDMERCPFCGGQLFGICLCECVYERLEKLGIDVSDKERVEEFLSGKRIPYISYPNLCARCGTLWPEMFRVPDAEWEHYIEPRMRQEMLCRSCYKQIKAWIDAEGLGVRKPPQWNKRLRKQMEDAWRYAFHKASAEHD